MKKVILIIISALSVLIVHAQTPAFEWANGIGSTGLISVSSGNSIAVDASGNVYTVGTYSGTVDFDPGPGIDSLHATSGGDVFISKSNASGNFLWAKSMHGNILSGSYGNSIAIDALGNICITGFFNGTIDFDPGIGIDSISSTGSGALFISKLDASGNFLWTKTAGGLGSSEVAAFSITLDTANNIYTTGVFDHKIDFDPGPGIDTLNAGSVRDMFILKLDTSGNFIWAKNIGAPTGVVIDANSIVVDAANNIYTTGEFTGTVDFDPGTGTTDLTNVGSNDMFVLKLDISGNFLWAKNMGGPSGSDVIKSYSINVDGSGNVYTTGPFKGTEDFDPGAGTANLTSVTFNSFISKLDSAGNFVWVKDMGIIADSGDVSDYSIITDAAGNIYSTGSFNGTVDFDPGAGVVNLSADSNSTDMFILKLNPLGNFDWAKVFGGLYNHVIGSSITLDATDNIYTTGSYTGTVDFDPGTGVFNLNSEGYQNAFVLKLSQGPAGINENTNENTISIYPNPTNGIFNLKMNELNNSKINELKIYNVLSECVYQLNASQINSSSDLQIDLTDQASGIYFIKVMSTDKIVSTEKIIKE